MKLCVDCRHYEKRSGAAYDRCHRVFPDPVRGGIQRSGSYSAWSRRDPNGICGPSAAGFEPKEEKPSQPHDQSI